MNWGTRIILGIAAFILFIMAMVAYMFKVHGRDALLEDDYYEKGLHYDGDYNAMNNVFADKAEPKINITASQLILQLRDSVNYELQLKCASKAKADLKKTGNTIGNSNLIVLDKAKLPKGLWFLELRWSLGQRKYLYKKDLVL